jgi:AcrR family transcriptional regulator
VTDEKALPSVWIRPDRRRERPALSRTQIVSAAIELLDAEGLDALTMRRLGGRIGAAATAMYSHVTNKDELIELVVDQVYGEVQVPQAADPADWRTTAAAAAHGVRSMIVAHPWFASAFTRVGFSSLGPNVMRWTDQMLAVFEAAGFTLNQANKAVGTIVAYVFGMGADEAAVRRLADSGQSDPDWVERLRSSVEETLQPYPRLRELIVSQFDQDPDKLRDDDFAQGLEWILDGLQATLDSASAGVSRRRPRRRGTGGSSG